MESDIKIKDYQFISEIGSGSFGIVYKAKKLSTQQIYAIKVISKRDYKQYELENIIHEFEIGIKIGTNPYLVGMIEGYQSIHNYFMVFEYCDMGTLDSYLHDHTISEQQSMQFLNDIFIGYNTLHENKIVHRDLKLTNILLKTEKDGTIRAKISDYGLSKMLSYSGQLTYVILPETVGTPQFMSPELLDSKGSNYQSDIFAIGVIYYFMLFKSYPFPAKTRGELREKLKEGKLIMDTSKLNILSAEFLLGALQYKMEDRYKEKHILESPIGNIPFDKMSKFEKAEIREFSIHKKYRVNDKFNDLTEI